jgi:DNA-directed RNA polymerase specialized sigma24 family protein
VDDNKAVQIQKRAFAYAFRLCGSREDAEDIAQLTVIEALNRERRVGHTNFKIPWLVIEVIRREWGNIGFRRSQFNLALKFAASIGPNPDDGDGENSRDYISEERLCVAESEPNEELSFVDGELLERIEDSNLGLREEELVDKYLWAHYKKHGIKEDLEIEWITL